MRETESAPSRRIRLILAGREHELVLEPGETIFAAALRTGLEPPFSCLAGYCGACVATLEEGDVTMGVNMILSPRQLARGLILTCQAVPERPCTVRFPEVVGTL